MITAISLIRTKIEATTWLSRGRVKQLGDRSQLWLVPLAVIGLTVAAVMFVLFLIENYVGLARLGRSLGTPQLVLFAAICASWLFSLVAAFPAAISIFYLSRDGRMLLAFPIPSGRIVAANYMLLYLYNLPLQILVFLPAVIVYLSSHGISAEALVASVVVTAMGSMIPIGLGLLLATGVTRVVNMHRHRVALEAAGMGLLVVLIIAFQTAVSRSLMNALPGAAPSAAMKALAHAFAVIQRFLVPASWAADSFVAVLPLFLFVLAGAAVTTTVFFVVRSGYERQLMEQASTSTGGGKRAHASRLPPPRCVIRALLGRELTILSSNSTFLFETIGEVLILPIVLVVFALVTPKSVISAVTPIISSFRYTTPTALAVLSLMAGLNTVSSSSISREGRNIGLSLMLPIRGSDHLRGKLACYIALLYPAFILNSVIVSAILSLSLLDTVVLIVAGAPVLLMLFCLNIYADLRRPLLDWNHPQQAMKQNMNVIMAMGLSICGLVAVGGVATLAALAGASGAVTAVTAGTVAGVIALSVQVPLRRYADWRYENAFQRDIGA